MEQSEAHVENGGETALAALRPRVWLSSLGVWALVAVLVTATVVHTHSRAADFVALLSAALPAWIAYVLLTPPVIALDAWLASHPRPQWVRVGALILGGALFVTLLHLLSRVVGSNATMPWSWVVYAVLVVLARSRRRRRMLRARELQAESLRRQLAEARVAALQSRLQPHFLFNTLHAVSATLEDDPGKARRMLVRLSDLLRSVLRLDAPEVSLASDIEILRPYVELQSIRFGERLDVRIDIPDDLRSYSVPALLLQPLVENAVTHGIGPRAEGGTIVVTAREEHGVLVACVSDDGVGPPADGAREGIGLGNLRERLDTLYGPAARLTIAPAAPRGTRVEVHIPERAP